MRRERADRIRAIGHGAAAFYAGLLTSREHVHSDAHRALLRLIDEHPAADVDRACARATHYGNHSVAALRGIIERRLFELPLDDLGGGGGRSEIRTTTIDVYRPLEAYAFILGGAAC